MLLKALKYGVEVSLDDVERAQLEGALILAERISELTCIQAEVAAHVGEALMALLCAFGDEVAMPPQAPGDGQPEEKSCTT